MLASGLSWAGASSRVNEGLTVAVGTEAVDVSRRNSLDRCQAFSETHRCSQSIADMAAWKSSRVISLA